MNKTDLIALAKSAAEKAHAPYSQFHVGAALLAESGAVYTGCNIENASYGATICAERCAFSKAISEGEKSFKAIAIVGWHNHDSYGFAYPCGICRQVISEFCGDEFKIILSGSDGNIKEFTLAELLPHAFGVKPI